MESNSAQDPVVRIPKISLRLSTSASNSGVVYATTARHDGATTSDEACNDQCELVLTITCKEKDVRIGVTRGGVVFT